jgi:hypothetical protein
MLPLSLGQPTTNNTSSDELYFNFNMTLSVYEGVTKHYVGRTTVTFLEFTPRRGERRIKIRNWVNLDSPKSVVQENSLFLNVNG